eukprot:TRINITY_DN64472_c0_g1_i1.p1 TRINITY_DN64472_c0_g1~~TRINITY_DN64472_c0_g1_i1.p1  ORF type:complete len:234 (+),score=33.21 TRINITY_DN64472_c0_g1_i1:101-802(+)
MRLLDAEGADAEPSSRPEQYFDEYFQVLAELMSHMEILANPPSFPQDPAMLNESRSYMCRQREMLHDISCRSFDHHDTSKCGVLDFAETQVLLECFVEHLVPYLTDAACKGLERSVLTSLRMQRRTFENDPAVSQAVIEQLMPKVEQAKQQMVEVYRHRKVTYASEKLARDYAALDVLVTSGERKLAKARWVEALVPDTNLHYEFLMALEMLSAEEVQEQRQHRGLTSALETV